MNSEEAIALVAAAIGITVPLLVLWSRSIALRTAIVASREPTVLERRFLRRSSRLSCVLFVTTMLTVVAGAASLGLSQPSPVSAMAIVVTDLVLAVLGVGL